MRIPSETEKVATTLAAILTEFMQETQSAGSGDYYKVDQKRFLRFHGDLFRLALDLDVLRKKSKSEAVWPRAKLSDIDSARLAEALRCAGCEVWGKRVQGSETPSTNLELADVMSYRLKTLAELCKYYSQMEQMNRNHWANFEHNFHLLRVIAITY